MDVLEMFVKVALVSIIAVISKEIKVVTKDFWSFEIPMWFSYCKLNKEKLEQTHLMFEVKSCTHARVILAEQYDSLRPSTEIIINKVAGYSRIRTCFQYPCDKYYHNTGDLLNCTSFQPFWVSWSEKIKFGKSLIVSQNELMSSNLSHSVNHVGLQTVSNKTDEWIIYQGQIIIDTAGDINCVAIQNYWPATQISTRDKSMPSYAANESKELELGTRNKNTECICECQSIPDNPFKHLVGHNITFDETKAVLKERLKELQMNITVNPRKTTRYNATNTSAPDDRLSATVAGWIGGCIIALVPTLVNISDVFKYFL